MTNRKKSPAIIDAVEFDLKLKPCEQFTLDNGVPVYTINAGEQEVMQVEWVFYAGNCFEHQNIVAATTNFLLKNGTNTKSAFTINEHFDFYGAYLNRSCHNETAVVTLHCLTKHLPELLPAVAELFTEAVLPEEELAIYKQNQKQRLEVNLKKCDFVANRLIDEYVFGLQHPYGKYTTQDDYNALEREQLVQFYQQYYTKGKCLLFVSGKLPENLPSLLNKEFGHLPFNQQPLPAIQYIKTPAANKKVTIVNDAEGVQGAVRMAIPFPNRHHPDFAKVQVLNTVFGGYFGSRLMSNIREDKGYTYGIHSHLQNHIHETAWLISTEAGRDVCAATIAEVYKEMQRMCDEPVEKEELDLVRNYLTGGVLGDLDGPFQIMSRWKNYVLNNLTDAYFYNSLHTIRTITAEELQELARKYFVPDAFYELVVV